jgi:branched-chain amino acid transport system ATP-binding protein
MALLELRNLSKSFGNVRAVDGIDLDVEKGEVVGIVGPNGSGKTTLLNVISGFYRPGSGTITYKGKKIGGLRPDTITSMGIVRTFQQNVVYWDTNALENIVRTSYLSIKTNLWASFFNTRSYVKEEEMIRTRAMEIASTCGLSDYSYTPAASLPHGKQRSLGMAMGLAANPELLLLDEPLAGMDAAETEIVAQNIKKIIDKGLTVMMVEHNIASVIRLCPRIVVLDFGHKLADGKPEEVLSRPDVVEAYLGVDE